MTLLSEAIRLFGLDAASADWGYAADWFEDQGGCPVLAQAMRSGIYQPDGSWSGSGYGSGDGDGDGDGDGYGDGYGDGDGDG